MKIEEQKPTISNECLYTINFKDKLELCPTQESTSELASHISKQLDRIEKSLISNKIYGEVAKYYILNDVTDCKNNFEFLCDITNGKILKDEWDDLSFDGDFTSLSNEYLTMLYDLCDSRVIDKNGISKKFIWIN